MNKIKIVVPISGGKDSQACMKLAMHRYHTDNILGLFCDTKFEHPKTYDHIKKVEDLYQIKIYTVSAGSVPEKVIEHNRFPGYKARHCTSELKIRPSKEWYQDLALQNGPFEVWYGIRVGESRNRENKYKHRTNKELILPHEFMPDKYPKKMANSGIMFRLPIIDWSIKEVMYFLDGEHNPLYDEGFNRVGCFPCLASGDENKNQAFDFDDFGASQRKIVEELEIKIGKSIWTSVHGKDKYCNSGCSICEI